MQNLHHPAVSIQGIPRVTVTYSGWEKIVKAMTAAIAAEPEGPAKRRLVAQRMDALAAKDAAWIRREAALKRLLS